MTEQEQNITIAEVCGTHNVSPHPSGWVLTDKSGYTGLMKMNGYEVDPKFDFPRSYTTDLNTCHEMEKVLKSWGEYEYSLRRMLDQQFVVHATAAQRAEAFLRTLNLWKD